MAVILDRDALIQAGWRQGFIIDGGQLPEEFSDKYYLILTQTCDCLNPKLAAEPTLELLPLIPKGGKNKGDPKLQNGINPRKIEFPIIVDKKKIWVASSIPQLVLLAKEHLVNCAPSQTATLDSDSLEGVIDWRVARYLRTAFPEAFEKAFAGKKDEIHELIVANRDLVQSLLISLKPFEEISEPEGYEVELVILATPANYRDNAENLRSLAARLTEHLDAMPRMDNPGCVVISTGKMTLEDRRKYRDFSRYDYLSFGEA